MVDVASSWSAIRTRAALTAPTRASPGSGLSRAASRAARAWGRSRPSGSSQPRPAGDRRGRGGPGQGLHHGGGHPGGDTGDHLGAEVGPQSIVGTGHHHHPAHPVGGRQLRRWLEVERRPRLGRRRLPRSGPPGCGRSPPQPVGHLLEGGAGGQLGGRNPPVDRSVVGQLGHRRGDRGHAGLDRLALTRPAGQTLDVAEVEQALPPLGGRVGDQQAAAHVGVEGGHLDPESAGRLVALQHAVHPVSLRGQ